MEKITFENGFRIMLEPLEYVRSCSMGVWVGSGSRFETMQTSGISHFIEHMVFKGTDRRSAFDIATQMDEIGGALNAYTTKEYTCFYARSLTEHIDRAFNIICDMITSPRLDDHDIALEKGVVLEELNSYEDSSEDLCMDTFFDETWADDMLGKNIVGTRDTINSFDADTIRKHMSEYYVPERMVAVFTGKFDREYVIELCRRYFGDMKNTDNPLTAGVVGCRKFIKTVRKDFEQNIIALGLPGISSRDNRKYACNYMCSILGGSGSSRLFQRIREELGLVYSIDAFNTAYNGAGVTCITMGLAKKSEKKALTETLKIVSDFVDTITEKEIQRSKDQVSASVIMSLESPSSISARLGVHELLYNNVCSTEELARILESVTPDEVRSVAADILDMSKLSLCAVGKTNPVSFYRDILNNIG